VKNCGGRLVVQYDPLKSIIILCPDFVASIAYIIPRCLDIHFLY
jgi:hypothetical protein